MRIALHVFKAAAPVRKSRRHAQRWKNIPVDRICAADDAFIIILVAYCAFQD
jgi:hypothetical protein